MTRFEFGRGDVIVEIDGRLKYIILDHVNVNEYRLTVDDNSIIARADKAWIERQCVKVGTWDFDSNVEVNCDD